MNLVQKTIFMILFICITNTLGFYRLGNFDKFLSKIRNNTHGSFHATTVTAAWIKQPLDHFDKTEKRTWRMRYFRSLDFWRADGPIYLFINGENHGSDAFIRIGILHELAKETNGALYASEHRYYGKSRPFQELSTNNLVYLSSRQALADIARLVKQIRKIPQFNGSKLVVVGGSYAGNLAAWMRLLYPELVDAAIASSAPVFYPAKKDFYEYLESVSDGFEQYGTSGCNNAIRNMFGRYEKLFQTNSGIEELKKEEEICSSTDMLKPENKQIFFLDKAVQFMYEVQYGNPDSIKSFCEEMKKTLKASAKSDKYGLWSKTRNCFNYDFDDMIESMKQVDWVTAWTYQTCTEFGYFMSSSSKKHPFTNNLPINLYYRVCTKMYGSAFDEKGIDKGIKTTNEMYASLRYNISHVVFVNGDLDPWARLGVLEDISYNAPSKVIPRSSHCNDLFSNELKDSVELKEAKTYIKYVIKEWIHK